MYIYILFINIYKAILFYNGKLFLLLTSYINSSHFIIGENSYIILVTFLPFNFAFIS